ncbi:DUF6199 family natural product biosynthesis protein [Streptomyces sp. NB004]
MQTGSRTQSPPPSRTTLTSATGGPTSSGGYGTVHDTYSSFRTTRLQRGWVRSPEATEPTSKGYAMNRVVGVVFLGFVMWMLVQQF